MGTQFSKIKVTQRVELHGDVFNHADGHYDAEELPDLFTRRAHHSGVLSGHELLSYSFLAGQACEPRRSLRRRHRSKSLYSSFRSNASSRYVICSSEKDLRPPSCILLDQDSSSDDICSSKADRSPPDSELDSGISVNVNYENPERYGHRHRDLAAAFKLRYLQEEDYENDKDELYMPSFKHQAEINTPAAAVAPAIPEPLPTITEALKRHYQEYFADWFEPGTTQQMLQRSPKSEGGGGDVRRRSSRKKNLHQKLVLSTMNTKKAAKLDMDDRAKMVQYFSKPGDMNSVESVKIEDMFGTCWSVPRACPPLPTVITVQAPAGIGKSSMLKYMCMKWGCNELWTSNFDVLIFVECRTLNRLGSMTGRQFMTKIMDPIEGKVTLRCQEEKKEETAAAVNADLLAELSSRAGAGRVLLLLDGLDEVHDVGNLATIRQPAGHPDRLGQPGRGAADTVLTPLEFAQCLLTGALLQGCHVIVTSRPHTLSHLQSSRWFLSLPKRMVSLDIQGLSEEGVQSFIHSYVEARLHVDSSNCSNEERPCKECCPCHPLQERARSDPYIFSLATNPFYLWLICTIFSEAGEDFIPKTLTQLYTWVMLVFANRWQNTSLQMTTSLDSSTVDFLLGFARLCYHLVRSGNIKMTAIQTPADASFAGSSVGSGGGSSSSSSTSGGGNGNGNGNCGPVSLSGSGVGPGGGQLTFPAFGGVSIDQDRAETFGLMTVSQSGARLECEFRHLSLAEYLTALHVHVTGDSLKGFPRDRKELILQYLSGLASSSESKDQVVVKEFLQGLGSCSARKDALEYLKYIQRMKGEWYNQQGLQKQMLFMRCAFESRQQQLNLYPFPGLKVINIRGCALLALDLIIIGNFVAHLADDNRLLELALRDYPLDKTGLLGLMPCLPLVRTVTLCARKLKDPDCYDRISKSLESTPRSRLRELFLLELPPAVIEEWHHGGGHDLLGEALFRLKEVCRLNNVKINI